MAEPRIAAAPAPGQIVRLRAAAIGFVALLLVTFIGTTPLQSGTVSLTTGSDVVRQVLVVAICGVLMFGTHVRGQWRRTLALPLSLIVLLAYCVLTVGWALAPMISLRRLVLTAATVWAVFRAVRELGDRRTLVYLRNVALVVLALCWGAVLFTDYGIHGIGFGESEGLIGDWRGIFGHKNTAGSFLGLVIVLLVFDPLHSDRRLRLAALAAAGMFLAMTQCKTAVAVLMLALAVGFALRAYRPRHHSLAWLAVGATVLLALALGSMFEGDLVQALDDPHGFSGRSHVWSLMVTYARGHMWSGVGFESFWQIGPSSPIWTLTNDWAAEQVGQGHNGYLDLLVTIGIPGLVLAIAALFLWPALLLLGDTRIAPEMRAFLGATLFFVFGDNMSESTLLDRMSGPEVVLLVCVALIHRSAMLAPGEHQAIRRNVRGALRRGLLRMPRYGPLPPRAR